TRDLNAQGIIVRLRVLLVYPYSMTGQERIEAEMNCMRSSVTEPKFRKRAQQMEQLCVESFHRSSLVTTLHRVIRVIHDWRARLGPRHPLVTYPNRFDVRFICLDPKVCGLRVNGLFFND